MRVDQLHWDSEFFGIPIGRLHLDHGDEGAIADAEREARALGIQCLYASLDPVEVGLGMAVQQAGFRLVDVAMDLIHRTSTIEVRPETTSVARRGTVDDLPALEEEIVLMAPWSRFAVDPRFGLDAARRMHRAWVERAVSAEDRMLVVAEDETGITAFSTLSTLEGHDPRIDLIASSRSGSGAAYALVDFEFAHFGSGRSWGGPIAARNVPSLRFCEHMGYRVGTVRYLYHRWLDE